MLLLLLLVVLFIFNENPDENIQNDRPHPSCAIRGLMWLQMLRGEDRNRWTCNQDGGSKVSKNMFDRKTESRKVQMCWLDDAEVIYERQMVNDEEEWTAVGKEYKACKGCRTIDLKSSRCRSSSSSISSSSSSSGGGGSNSSSHSNMVSNRVAATAAAVAAAVVEIAVGQYYYY
jgi:uncharacterized membrane protein YgcG